MHGAREAVRELVRDDRFHLVVLTSVLAVSGVSLIAPALPAIATGLGVPEGDIGLLLTAFTLPAIVVLPFSGFLADTLGRNRVMALGCLLIGLGGAMPWFVYGFLPLLAFRAVQGVGYAGVMPITVALIGDLYRENKETQAQGLRTASNKVAGMAWMVVGGVLAAAGWRSMFLVYLLFVPLAALLYWRIPAFTGEPKPVRTYLRDIGAVAARPKMTVYLSIGFVRFFLKYSILTLLPLLLATRFDMPSRTIGVTMALLGAGGILSAAAAGFINERFRKTSTVFASLALIGAACVVLGWTGNRVLVVVMVGLIGLADAAMSPLHKSLLTHNVAGDQRAGVITTNSIGQNIGKTAGPLAVSLLYVLGPATLFAAIGAATIVTVTGYVHARTFLAARNLYP